MVKFLDLSKINGRCADELKKTASELIDSGSYIMDSSVMKFQNEFAEYTESSYCSGVSNGLDALVLALTALGIGAGDEVIVPSHTFIATWIAVSRVGAKIIPVEVDNYFNLDASKVEEKISKKTKAVIAVHLYGLPADLEVLLAICKKNNIFLIEDAAQAHGSTYKGKKIGGFGDATCWSFYPGKNLGCLGDGGAITTNSLDLKNRIEELKNYGSSKKYVHETIGFNARLDPIQARFLSIKLKLLDEDNQIRRKIAQIYGGKIKSEFIVLPKTSKNSESSWHLYVIQTKYREKLKKYLLENGIETLIHYPISVSRQNAYKNMGYETPYADFLAEQVMSLPIGPHMTEDDAYQVVKIINKFRA